MRCSFTGSLIAMTASPQQGKIVREIQLTVDNPHPHHDTRLARKLASGNYLVCHERDGKIREYDAEGNLRDWWTADDAKEFDARTQKLVDLFDGFIAIDTIHCNGRFTLGENLGDLGGVSLAYEAWKLSLAGKPAPAAVGGFTPEQRFFLSYGQVWRNKLRPEFARLRAMTDVHSLPRWRVLGPLMNLPEFAKAFGCQAGDPMVLAAEKRTEVW